MAAQNLEFLFFHKRIFRLLNHWRTVVKKDRGEESEAPSQISFQVKYTEKGLRRLTSGRSLLEPLENAPGGLQDEMREFDESQALPQEQY